jgi:hypothetical protein
LKSGALPPAGRSWWAKATFYISWLLYILAILIVPASHAVASEVGPEAGPMASYIVEKFPSWQAYLVGLSVFSVTGSTVEYMLDKKMAPSTARFFVLVIVTAVITVVLLLRLAASLLVSALLIAAFPVLCLGCAIAELVRHATGKRYVRVGALMHSWSLAFSKAWGVSVATAAGTAAEAGHQA